MPAGAAAECTTVTAASPADADHGHADIIVGATGSGKWGGQSQSSSNSHRAPDEVATGQATHDPSFLTDGHSSGGRRRPSMDKPHSPAGGIFAVPFGCREVGFDLMCVLSPQLDAQVAGLPAVLDQRGQVPILTP
jgi:hypothetical protein